MRRDIDETHYSQGLAGLSRRDTLKVLGAGALGSQIAAAVNEPRAEAASAPIPPRPTADPAEEHQKAKNPFNPCGMRRRPEHFTGPFHTNYITYIINSPNQAYDLPLRVLLPDKLENIESPRVLYVLPAAPGIVEDDGLLSVLDANLHNKYGLIAVSPSFSDWPWYADNPDKPKIRQETYFINEIVPFVDKLYPKASEVRLLVGISKSGNGAFQMILRHPDLFRAAAIFDSPIMYNTATQFEAIDIYGNNTNFVQNYCIPQLLLGRADLFRGKPPRLAIFGYCLFGGPHPMFGPHLQEAHAFLEGLGIPHIYDSNTCRNHRYRSGWLEGAVAALDKMSRS